MKHMTWEEIIVQIRKDPAYKELVELAYFEEELPLNVERFRRSEEYQETWRLIREMLPGQQALKIADIGAGNGIAAVAFALDGCAVTAIEPDPSETIGAGAIRKLKAHYQLSNLDVIEAWGEQLPVSSAAFDVVYVRQAMHHAAVLDTFVQEAARLLRPGGLLVTVRDHVIYDEKDKQWFLEAHLLHKFYGGENAFTYDEYAGAIRKAGLDIEKVFRHYDSVINYFPETADGIAARVAAHEKKIADRTRALAPRFFSRFSFVRNLYREKAAAGLGNEPDERKVPGRLISFFARKRG